MIIAYIHGDRYATRSSLVSNVQQLLFPQKLLQKIVGITHAITIQAIMKKYQRANHVVMEIRITRASNNNSQGIYILRVGQS